MYDKTMEIERLQEIISKIRSQTSKKNIEIGLQVNVFEATANLVTVMNNMTWVSHKINPLSDAALAILYQWVSNFSF
uniref:Uncharacterized protein n=1 Tax=Panagrolaimus sp. ES5 TaxID=591445 RepID=A0AC34F4B2_9BILA